MVVTGNRMQIKIPYVSSLHRKKFDLIHRKVLFMIEYHAMIDLLVTLVNYYCANCLEHKAIC